MPEWLQQLSPPANLAGPQLVSYVLFDVFLIIVLARVLGGMMVRIHQPRVVGEILAGILLGPTLLGENLSHVIAPQEVRPLLNMIATMGLILFMFLAGVEYETSRVRGRAGQAILLALLSVLIPAAVGFPVARVMHSPAYSGPAGSELLPFALFIGASLSVTAFPVMAHILMERGELNSLLGSLAVATTGIMSVLMFMYIAFAGTVASSAGSSDFMMKVVWIVVFALTSWFIVRPLLARVMPGLADGEIISGNGMAIAFAGMVLYGLIGHVIGINALVGGFVWGLILPDDRSMRRGIASRIRDLSMIFFLPVFFAMAGFSTDLKLITLQTLPILLLVLLAAVGSKFLAAGPARAFGFTWRETGVLGALFNTRGLLVLVAGLIGLQLAIISTLTFTIIVIVALVTNLMTLPLMNLFQPARTPQPLAAD